MLHRTIHTLVFLTIGALAGCGRDTTAPTASSGADIPDRAKEQIAFVSDRDNNQEIYRVNSDGTGLTRLTRHPERDFDPAWSPDGTRITFVAYRSTAYPTYPQLYAMSPDGTDLVEMLSQDKGITQHAWAPGGRQLAIITSTRSSAGIFAVNTDGTGLNLLTDNWRGDSYPRWSPDGTRIAFVSSRDGNQEIYVMDAGGSNQINLTNDPGDDRSPAWSPYPD